MPTGVRSMGRCSCIWPFIIPSNAPAYFFLFFLALHDPFQRARLWIIIIYFYHYHYHVLLLLLIFLFYHLLLNYYYHLLSFITIMYYYYYYTHQHTHAYSHKRTRTRTHTLSLTHTHNHTHTIISTISVLWSVDRSTDALLVGLFYSILGLFCIYSRSLLLHTHTIISTISVLWSVDRRTDARESRKSPASIDTCGQWGKRDRTMG